MCTLTFGTLVAMIYPLLTMAVALTLLFMLTVIWVGLISASIDFVVNLLDKYCSK